MLKATGKEIKRLYRKSKKLTDTDKHILSTLIIYLIGLILLPISLFTFFDKNNVIFLIFIPFLLWSILTSCMELRQHETRLVEMSRNFKYYVSHKIVTLATIYWNGDY